VPGICFLFVAASDRWKQLTDFKSEYIRDFDYSYDGKQLAIIRGHRESDVVVIRGSEK
jgi:hypothetical protein